MSIKRNKNIYHRITTLGMSSLDEWLDSKESCSCTRIRHYYKCKKHDDVLLLIPYLNSNCDLPDINNTSIINDCISYNDTKKLKLFLSKHKFDLNKKMNDYPYVCPLLAARNVDMIKLLVDNGANVNVLETFLTQCVDSHYARNRDNDKVLYLLSLEQLVIPEDILDSFDFNINVKIDFNILLKFMQRGVKTRYNMYNRDDRNFRIWKKCSYEIEKIINFCSLTTISRIRKKRTALPIDVIRILKDFIFNPDVDPYNSEYESHINYDDYDTD